MVRPRPQMAREVAEYSDVRHWRLLIKPGISGLWKVSQCSVPSPDGAIRLDLRDVENRSLTRAVAITMRGFGTVLHSASTF